MSPADDPWWRRACIYQVYPLADFDQLVAESHARGLKVIVDFVPNHTSEAHPWFVESRENRDNPKRDWFIWRDGKPDGAPPTNWLSEFGGPAWTKDPGTGQYYYHAYLPQQPDLNWRNPDARAAMLEALRFWLARGVDGFATTRPTRISGRAWRRPWRSTGCARSISRRCRTS